MSMLLEFHKIQEEMNLLAHHIHEQKKTIEILEKKIKFIEAMLLAKIEDTEVYLNRTK